MFTLLRRSLPRLGPLVKVAAGPYWIVGCVFDFTTNLPLARRTQSFAEERRQDSLQVRLPAQELVTAFPDDDVTVESVGQFLVEASPLSVHACACEGWCHRCSRTCQTASASRS